MITLAKAVNKNFTNPLPCAGRSDLFFAGTYSRVEQARAICGTCQLKDKCLETALARQEPCGVWGGELLGPHGIVKHVLVTTRNAPKRRQPLSGYEDEPIVRYPVGRLPNSRRSLRGLYANSMDTTQAAS